MLAAEILDLALFASTPRFGDLSIHGVIDLRRSFPREALVGAVEAAAAAFPVLDRRYEPRFFRDRWVPAEGPAGSAVHVVDAPADLEAETLAWVRRPLALTKERPIRLVSLGRGQGSRLLLSLSHLAVDGAGMAAVAHVLGAHLFGVPPSLPVDPRRDLGRALGRLGWHHVPLLAKEAAAIALLPLRVFRCQKRDRPYPEDPSAGPSVRRLSIPAADLARLRARSGATVNDLLVAALARAAGQRTQRGPVPVVYTMDLRRYASSPALTAANTSTLLITLVPRDTLGDLPSAAAAVSHANRSHRQGLTGPAALLTPIVLTAGAPHAYLRRLVPALHRPLVDMPVDRGLVMTNVGKLDEGLRVFGDAIEDIRVMGPKVDGVKIPVVVAFGFRGDLHLSLFSPPGLGDEALAALEGELREALEMAPAQAAS